MANGKKSTPKEEKWARKAVGDVNRRYKKAKKHLSKKMKVAQKKERSRPILAQALMPGTDMAKILHTRKRVDKEALKQAKQDVGLIKDYGVGEKDPRKDARKSKAFMSHMKKTKRPSRERGVRSDGFVYKGSGSGVIRKKTGGHIVDSYDY
jgi:hypothetical protein